MNENKFPPLPKPKFTETIRGVPCITVTEHEHLMRAYALQARAQVQGEVCPTCGETEPYTGSCGTSNNDTKALCKQPAQATQVEVTDEQIIDIAAQWSNKEFAEGAWRFCTDFARAILALRPERVPMTDDEHNDMICTVTTLCAKLSRRAIVGMAIDWTEAHHGITAQAKKEDA